MTFISSFGKIEWQNWGGVGWGGGGMVLMIRSQNAKPQVQATGMLHLSKDLLFVNVGLPNSNHTGVVW